jgi:cytochrome c553
MSDRSLPKLSLFVLSLFLLVAFAEINAYSAAMEPKALFEKRCSRCHSLDKTNRTESAEYWKSTVQKMKKKFFSGIKDEDAAIITEYLVKTKVQSETVPAPEIEQPADK